MNFHQNGHVLNNNLRNMMERLGIPAAGCVVPRLGGILVCAFHTCRGCQTAGSCRTWLAAASADIDAPPDFCPNSDLLDELLNEPSIR